MGAVTAVITAPWVAFLLGTPWLSGLAGALLLARVGTAATIASRGAVGWAAVPLAPLAQFFFIALVLNSAQATLRAGGIDWRGTFYSIEDLKAGQRFKPSLF